MVRLIERLGYEQRSIGADAVLVVRVFHVADATHGYGRQLCELLLRNSLVLAQLPDGQLVNFGNETFSGDLNQLLIVVVQHYLCLLNINILMLKCQ